MRDTLFPLVVVLGIAACGGPKQPEQVRAPAIGVAKAAGSGTAIPAALQTTSVDPALIQTLATLATGSAPMPDEVMQAQHALDTRQLTMDQYINKLLSSPQFATDVAPLMVMRENLTRPVAGAGVSGYILNKTKDQDPVYFIEKPCPAKQAVRVHPWWDLDHEVRVCPDSYRPDQWMTKTHPGDLPMACRALGAKEIDVDGGGERCGCGPNLMRCFESAAQRTDYKASLLDELRYSVAHVVTEGAPIEDVFTGNATWRDRRSEFIQIQQLLESKQEKDPTAALRAVAAWPEKGIWAPREEIAPGEHAGVLTTTQLLYMMPDLRQRMTLYYNILFCQVPDSAGATPEQAITITNPNLQLQSGGWQQLAAKPVCTNCHARLDYGLQYFTGWPNGYTRAFYFVGNQQSGKGPFYMDNIQDHRGDAQLTPNGFAKIATAQPEFKRCMAQDVGSYVFGSALTKSTLNMLADAASASDGVKLKRVMASALKQFVKQWDETRPSVAQVPATAQTDAAMTLNKEQHAALDKFCTDCHDNSGEITDFTTTTIPRATVVKMLSNVAFDRMPKNDPLADVDRRAFLETFIPSMWTGADAARARRYFEERMAALPAFRPEVMFDLIEQRVGKRGGPWRTLEQDGRGKDAQVTPGLVTIFGVATIEACRSAHSTREEIDHCLEATLLPDTLAIRPR